MQHVRPWQIGLFAAAVLVLGASVYFTFVRGGLDLEHRVLLVDVQSGQLYAIDTSGKTIPIPARSPETGNRTLYPITKSDDGEWYIFPRAIDQMKQSDAKPPASINLETGRVAVQSESILQISTKDLLKQTGS